MTDLNRRSFLSTMAAPLVLPLLSQRSLGPDKPCAPLPDCGCGCLPSHLEVTFTRVSPSGDIEFIGQGVIRPDGMLEITRWEKPVACPVAEC